MRVLTILLTVLVAGLPAAGAPATPSARDVVVRGGKDLADLLARATSSAWKEGSAARPVAIVVDVTPHTAAAKDRLVASFVALGERITHLSGDWRIGALGRRLSFSVRHPSALPAKIPAVLAVETTEVNTFRALGKTLSGFGDRGGVVVYLADWRFEDDDELEGLISRLKGRGQTLKIIGSEGCFGRAWNDGLPRFTLGDAKPDPGVGRNPFGPRNPDAPWHGGDTACPHAPYSFGSLPWKTEFPLTVTDGLPDGKGFEDLRQRIGGGKSTSSSMQLYPLASSFGPYALMRAAAETGGSYYLYSWNPQGRVDVVYDYGKCNIFQPDLRPRREILTAIRSDPIPSTMVKVWRKLADPALRIVDVSPPFTPSGAPDNIDRVPAGQGLSMFWPEKADLKRFLAKIEKHIRALDRASANLERALSAPPRTSGPWPRYRADAMLLHHTVRVLRFEMREAREAARRVPDGAWDDPERIPGIHARDWIQPGNDPEDIRTTSMEPFDNAAGARILEARKRHLETYGGTPFGETVARNAVVTYRCRKVPNLKSLTGGGLGRTPSESSRDAPETPDRGRPGRGGSTGGGPSSGK